MGKAESAIVIGGGGVHTCLSPSPQPAARRCPTAPAPMVLLHRAGTDRTPPVNPIFEYAVDVLGLSLAPKHRDGPGATALYDRRGRAGVCAPGVWQGGGLRSGVPLLPLAALKSK